MGQISIPMSNKVGYSMYWNSMWDNKINYSRSLKEDIYLNKIINLFFEDNVSTNILKTPKKFQKNQINVKKYNLHSKSVKIDFVLLKYLNKFNKIKIFPAKLWILKYQRWVILFYFIYLPHFNKYKKTSNVVVKNNFSLNNFFNLYTFYKKVSIKSEYSFNFFKKIQNKNVF